MNGSNAGANISNCMSETVLAQEEPHGDLTPVKSDSMKSLLHREAREGEERLSFRQDLANAAKIAVPVTMVTALEWVTLITTLVCVGRTQCVIGAVQGRSLSPPAEWSVTCVTVVICQAPLWRSRGPTARSFCPTASSTESTLLLRKPTARRIPNG